MPLMLLSISTKLNLGTGLCLSVPSDLQALDKQRLNYEMPYN